MAYFAAAISGTCLTTFLLRNSTILAKMNTGNFIMNPYLFGLLSLGCLNLTTACDYDSNWYVKNAFYACFVGITGLTFVPLLHVFRFARFA